MYFSNYFMEKEIEKKGHTDTHILFKTVKKRTTPTNKLEMEVIL